jgi:hypothetical protein
MGYHDRLREAHAQLREDYGDDRWDYLLEPTHREAANMRIMDLDFNTAIKYAWLGDRIYRLRSGSKASRILLENYAWSELPMVHPSSPFEVNDIFANDWVAETTERSV